MKKTLLLFSCAILLMSSFMSNAQSNKIASGSNNSNGINARLKNPSAVNTGSKNGPGQMQTNALSGYLSEGFEGTFPPAGWQVVDVQDPTYIWAQSTASPYEGVSSAYISYTSTVGITGEDWLIAPQFTVASSDSLSFFLKPEYLPYPPDSTLILVSTTDSALTSFTTVLATLAEGLNYPIATNYEYYAFSLSAFAGQDIYIAIVNKNEYGDGIFIDKVTIGTLPLIDMSASAISKLPKEYTKVPLVQGTNVLFNGTVLNNGGAATTGGSALFEVINTTTTATVFNETVPIPNLAPSASAILNTSIPFTFTANNSFKVRLTTTLTGDANAANDILESSTFDVTDSVYARDNDVNLGSLGIGVGLADGLVGQNFDVTNPATLTSVSFYLTDAFDPNPSGSPVWVTLHSQTPGSEPSNTVLATTDSVLILPGTISTPGQWFTVPVHGGPAYVGSGLYYLGVHEYDSLLTLGTASAIPTPSTVWVSWNTIPSPPAVNGWAQASDFGFNTVVYQLRMNFGLPTAIAENDNVSSFDAYPNPFSDITNISLSLKQSSNVKAVITDVLGNELAVLCDKTLTQGKHQLNWDASTFSKGVYFCNLSVDGKTLTQKIVKL